MDCKENKQDFRNELELRLSIIIQKQKQKKRGKRFIINKYFTIHFGFGFVVLSITILASDDRKKISGFKPLLIVYYYSFSNQSIRQ